MSALVESVIDELKAARSALQHRDRDAALEHITQARRLIGDETDLCDATAYSVGDRSHFHAGLGMSTGHVCASLMGHDAPHLCECGFTWDTR